MANEGHAETGAAQKTSEVAQASNVNTAETNSQAEKPLTRTELKEILSDFRNGVNADIRKAVKPSTGGNGQHQETKQEDLTLKEQFTQFRTERDTERAALKIERRENELQKAVNAVQGIDDVRREMLLAFIEKKYGSQITVEGDPGKYRVIFTDADQSQKTVKDLVTAVMATPAGEFFLPSKATGNSDGQNGSNGSASQPHPYLAMTLDQIIQDKKTNADRFLEYLDKHEDDWIKKQRTLSPASFAKR